MPIDAGIYNALGTRPKSMMDYSQEYNALDQQSNQLAQGRMALQQAQDQMQQRNALRGAVQGGQLDLTNPDHASRALAIAPDVAPALLKTVQDSQTSRAVAAKDTAQAGHFNAQTDEANYGLRIKKANQAITDISALTSPEEALASLNKHLQAGDIDQQKYDAVKATIPQDPAQFPTWRKNMLLNILDAKTQLEVTKPVIQTRNTGGTTDTLAIDPITGKPVVTSSIKNTVSPDTAANNATSRANNRDTIAAENARAGVVPGGGLDDNSERTAQAIASGQLPAPTGMALLNPKNQRILGRVMEINPQYDSTTVTAKKKAASDFTTGQLGNSMRSFAVAGQHLEQLGQLVDAMDNGNMQVVNKIANAYSQQTGSPAVTNFDAAKDVVSKEVVKAIVAGGGGVAEREELSKLMSNVKSPAQLKGVIAQYRTLMAAQHDALLQQRDAAGLPRSTLPAYTDANGSAQAAPKSEWKYIGPVK